MRLLKRTLSAFLAFVMVFTMLPLQVWASETQQDTSDKPVNFGSMVEPAAGGGTEYDYTIRVGETKTVVREFLGLTWTSDNSGIVKISSHGGFSADITGIAPGEATITHKNIIDQSETFRVKVLPLVDSLTLDKETMTLTGKQTEKLTATLNPENAKVTVDWTSSDPAVATVDGEGNVTSVGVGTATITATASGTAVSDSCVVTVQEVQELAIKLEPLTLALSQTGTMALEYNPEPLGTPTLTWSVPEDSEIADIDPQTGVITPKKVGSVQVTATAQLGEVTATGTQDLTVTDKIQPTGIRLDKENMKLQRGAAEKLTATLEPDGAESKIVWSSSNARVATVDENGLVTSRGLGDTIITASVEGHPEIKDECRVNVEYDYATTDETKIYVYLEIKNETGKELEGWTINKSNFYTVGQYSVPFDILKPANHWSGHGEPLDKDSYVTRDISDITGYLPWTEFHPSNAAVVGSVDLSQIHWKLRYVTNGANHYQDKGACWHLDGLYTLKNEIAKVTVHYKDRFGNTVADSVTDNNIEIGDQYTIRIKDIPGYTPVSINGEPIKNGSTEVKQPVVGKDVTFTVIYNGNPTNYILEYKDNATREKIKDSETVESEKGKTILAKDIEREKIPNFEFVKITPDSIQVGKDGANTFTLWYRRSTHDVTYEYTDPITEKKVTKGPKTEGAGLEVTAEPIPNIPGYKFTGWVDEDESAPVIIEDGKFTMPDRNVTFIGSYSVPESQKYAVKATIKLANRVLASETEAGISWKELGQYYEMPPHELANAFWSLGLTGSENMTATWNPVKADAAMQYDADKKGQYHEVTITLNADSPALVTLTYDANAENDSSVAGIPIPKKYLKGTVVDVAPAPTRDNYRFTEWNTDADGNGTGYPVGSTIKLTDATTTLYAQWTPMTAEYKVQYLFQKADGSGYEQREDVLGYTASGNIGDTIKPTKLKDIPTGFDYKSHDTDVEITANGEAEAVVYYDRLTYTISWTVDGKNGQAVKEEKTLRFEETIGDKGTNPADPTPNAGYRFAGWKIENPGMTVLPGTMPAENIVITGSYAPIDYKVKYVAEGEVPEAYKNNPTVDNTVYHVDEPFTVQGDPSIPGYGFEGWKLPEDIQQNADGTYKMPAGDVTLYGKFSKRTDLAYTVKYIWNGEILNTESGTGTFGDPIDPEVKDFEGYTFKDKQTGVTITADETKNVVEVYYYKNVTLTANSDNNRIYNGKTQTAEPGYVSSEENAVFEGIVPTGSGKDAKEYPITFPDDTIDKVDKTKWYIVKEVEDGKLTINPKPVTLSTGDASRDYNGKPLTKDGVAGKEDFVAGDVMEVKATGEQILVGKSYNTIKITWRDAALAKNYTITENLGTLTVTAPKDFDYVQKTNREGNYTVGQTVEFTITVKNIYDVDATVQLNEQKDMTITGVDDKGQDTLPAGETKTYSVSHEVTEADVEAGQIANNVTWTLTPHDEDIPPVKGDDESIIKNESYLVWYVLEGDTKGCADIKDMPKQANHKYGKTVTVWMPELAEGYKFSGWTVEGAEIVDGKFSMPDNAVILTGTISKEQVRVDYKAQEGGLITDSNGLSDADLAEMVPYGENAKGATASAKMGYTFVEWQDANHKQVSTDPEFIPTNVTAPATYYAVFAKQKIKVEYTADVGGSITAPSGATFSSVIEQVTYGEDAVGATASAKPGYYFVEWQDAEGKQVGTELSFAPENVTKEAVYKAVFAKYYAVNYVPVGTPEGTDLPQPENPYRAGDEVVLMDAPKVDGYKFEGWYKDADCTEKAENFVMPAEDVTIYGKFERAYKVTYRLTDGISEMGVHFTIPDDFKPIDPVQYKPGEEVKVADEQILHDLDFTGWYCVEGNVKVEDGVFTMPAEDVVFEGGYVIRAYGVRHYFQDLYNPEKYIEQKNMSEFFLANGMEMTTAVALPAEWTPNVHALPFEQLPILPFQETVVKIKYDRDWYDVTYQLEGDVIPTGFTVPETKQHAYTATVTVAKAPRVEGYTFTGWTTEDAAVANGKFAMPNNAVTLTGKFELATDTKYTVEHYFENLGGGYPAEPNHTESKVGTTSQRTEAMPIPAGSITGFTVDGSWKQQTIKPDGSTVVKIYYTRNSYNLTVHYRNVGGAAVADSHHGTYKFGETWMVVSPIVAGYYDPQIRSISSGANGMPAQDLEYVVIYTAIPVPAPDPGPGPAPNPGPDDGDDDDDTPPVPDPEQEQPPQPQDFEIDPDDYTLTEVEDNETPLANLNLEGHTCCILHLLLMLAAMVVLGFDTKSRKKRQARIFELKKMLAMEEDHSDDPEQP